MVVPACLRKTLPDDIHVTDERGRAVTPALGGYALKPGRPYAIAVDLLDPPMEHWRLEVIIPHSLGSRLESDFSKSSHRVTFDTSSHGLSQVFAALFGRRGSITVKGIRNSDRTEMFRLYLPIMLQPSRLSAAMGLLLLLASFPIGYLLRGLDLTAPETYTLTNLLFILFVAVVLFAAATMVAQLCRYIILVLYGYLEVRRRSATTS